jgi:hypothetical protein
MIHTYMYRGKFFWGDGPWKGHEYDGEWNMDRMEGKAERQKSPMQ